MLKEFSYLSVILLVAGLLGLSIGYTATTTLLGALSYCAWTMYRIELLRRWLAHPKRHDHPKTCGQLLALSRLIDRRNSKHRKRKRKLTNYLKQFRDVASVLPDAIVIIDQAGKISWANNNAVEIFGIQSPNHIGVNFIDLVQDPKVETLFSDDKNDFNCEVEYTPKGDLETTINIQVRQYTKDLRLVVGRDISKLLKLNQIQSDFVANVSHELKTPLTVFKGYLDIIRKTPELAPQLSNVFAQMQTQSDRMELIVNDLLYLAKLENHEEQVSHEQVDITSIINSAIETIDESLTEKQLTLNLNIDYELRVLGSQTELHAAFSNLIFNAVNYTPRQGVININWETTNEGVCFSVRDNGEGIPQSHLPRLTQRFYRVDSDRSRDGGGTGLGLAIVKHVMQRHNASLQIKSSLGVGSEFTCIFPKQNSIIENDVQRVV